MAMATRCFLHRSQLFGKQSLAYSLWRRSQTTWPRLQDTQPFPCKFLPSGPIPSSAPKLFRSFSQSSSGKDSTERMTTAAHAAQDCSNEVFSNGNFSTREILTVPTMLTAARVVAVPALIFVFFSNQSWASGCSTGIFIAACLTDWLDGYIARKMKLGSAFGAFLDPVADKLMVATALVLLCSRPLAASEFSAPWLIPLPAAIMISREIIISAVREWAALQGGHFHKVVAVDKLGKLKTATQMISLTLLLAFGDARDGVQVYMSGLGVGLLYASTGLSLWSLSGYMRRLWHRIKLQRSKIV